MTRVAALLTTAGMICETITVGHNCLSPGQLACVKSSI